MCEQNALKHLFNQVFKNKNLKTKSVTVQKKIGKQENNNLKSKPIKVEKRIDNQDNNINKRKEIKNNLGITISINEEGKKKLLENNESEQKEKVNKNNDMLLD